MVEFIRYAENEYTPVDSIVAGDIGAIPKLNGFSTGDTISTKVKPIKLNTIEFAVPYTVKRIVVDNKQNEKSFHRHWQRLWKKIKPCFVKMM